MENLNSFAQVRHTDEEQNFEKQPFLMNPECWLRLWWRGNLFSTEKLKLEEKIAFFFVAYILPHHYSWMDDWFWVNEKRQKKKKTANECDLNHRIRTLNYTNLIFKRVYRKNWLVQKTRVQKYFMPALPVGRITRCTSGEGNDNAINFFELAYFTSPTFLIND